MDARAGARSTTGELPRERLIDRILGCPEPVIVLDAPAGMGKSTLLRQIAARTARPVITGETPPAITPGALGLWDIPAGAEAILSEAMLAGGGRLVVAKRPESQLRGLARAIAYRKALVLGAADLLIGRGEMAAVLPPRRAARIMARSGGWPLLLPYADGPEPDMAALESVIDREMLEHLPARTLVALGDVLSGRALGPELVAELVPFLVQPGPDKAPVIAGQLAAPLARAYRKAWLRRRADKAQSGGIADALLADGRTSEAIQCLQQAGQFGRALDVLAEAGGFFYLYRHGSAEFEAVLDGFPHDFAMRHETLVLSNALRALKHGDVARARQLVADYFGAEVLRLEAVLASRASYSLSFRFFRVMMLIYEDVLVTDDVLEQLFGMLSELPEDAHLERGCFYNSLLEFYIRGRRFAEAEDIAVRARQQYRAAGVPILQFYISLHRAVIRLMQGDVNEAQHFAEEAAADLKAAGFESPNDERLFALLRACIDYEGGRAEPLARFLNTELDAFSHEEIWPTVVEFALQYGSQALTEHFSTLAARGFLDRWRIYQIHNRQFQDMLDVREVVVLQNGNRWQEAAAKLVSIRSPITREWVVSSRGELGRLQTRDQIALALAWLRQLTFEMPAAPGLAGQIEDMLGNLHITGRQKIGLELWLAYVLKHCRDLSRSRALLQKTMEYAGRLGALAPLAEERYFLAELVGNRRFRDFLHTSALVRQTLRRLADAGVAAHPVGARTGLSRRETKVLLMVAEGGSNKFIANALGVTEATVKYHLGNVYRKLGCSRRREAISAARALGLVS